MVRPRLEYCIQARSPYHKKDIEVLERGQKLATKMAYGFGDYKDRLSLLELPSLEERRVRGDLIEAYKLLKGVAKLDYSLFFKLSGNSKVRGHTYKIVKIVFAWMLGKISLVIEWWMHGMSCLSMWLMQKL